MVLHGWYQLRIVSVEHPNPGLGGEFITLGSEGDVTVAAQGPGTWEAQKWFVRAVDGGTDVYTIAKVHTEPGGLREGLLRDTPDTTNIPVVFSPDPQKWRISNIGPGDVYQIAPIKTLPIGVEHLVGTEDSKVVVKIFPVYPGDRPAWKLMAVDKD